MNLLYRNRKAILSFIILIFFTAVFPQADSLASPSFNKLAATPGWKIKPINIKARAGTRDHVFFVRISEGFTIGFQGQDAGKKFFGPIRPEHIPALSSLLDEGLKITGTSRKDIESINLDWELYPEKIAQWAQVWQACPLAEKNWKGQDLSVTLELIKKISQVVQKDMAPVMAEMGFDVTGVSMEKIFHFKAGGLSYYKTHLKPLGIKADFEMPIPMMMWLQVKAKDAPPALGDTPLIPGSFELDSIDASAAKGPSNIYFSFSRELNLYEVSGDRAEEDGNFTRLKVMQDGDCRAAAKNLLAAGFHFAGADREKILFLEMNPGLYPDAFFKLIEKIRTGPPFEGMEGFKRPEMPDDMMFYKYIPDPETGFSAQVNPFLNELGYRFSYFELSFSNDMKAKHASYFETLLKPAGIGPEEKPWRPYIVYMAIEKI